MAELDDITNLYPKFAGAPKRRSGYRQVEGVPDDSRIVAMVEFNETIFVATETSVYRLVDGVFVPVMFQMLDEIA